MIAAGTTTHLSHQGTALARALSEWLEVNLQGVMKAFDAVLEVQYDAVVSVSIPTR
jgi:hypothetical protein